MSAKNLNIRWKLFLYMSIFVFIMLIVLWLFQTVLLNEFYKAAKTRQVEYVARQIEKNVDSAGLPDLLDRILRHDNSMSVLIYSEDGEIIFSPRIQANDGVGFLRAAPVAPEPPPGVGIDEMIQKVKGRGNVSVVQPATEVPEPQTPAPERFSDRMIMARPARAENIFQMSEVINKSGDKVYILISALITPVDATVSTLRFQLLYITLILILIALILSLFISRKFAKPIMEINEGAKQLASGNYDVAFNTEGYREINELNDTLNNAAYELSRVDSLRRELLANVSHDLRTPLTMITGFAEMIRDLPGENTPENAQVIVDESNRLTKLVSDLLDISRLESGNAETKTAVFCITDTLKDTIARMSAALAAGRNVIFKPEESVFVNANESQIIQVIYNLIANALNYSDDDVTVMQVINGKTVRIEVRDSGQGISKADLPYVWDRYYKAPGPHKRSSVGTGLGLSIVKGVIKRHNGKCGADSGEGVGSIFWFELEAVKEPS